MTWKTGAALVLCTAGGFWSVWAFWAHRRVPALLPDLEAWRRARRTADGRAAFAAALVTVGLLLLDEFLAAVVVGFVAAMSGVFWASAHPDVHARDRPPGGGG